MTAEEEQQQAKIDRIVHDVAIAMNDLPVVARLEFVANVIHVCGGVRGSLGTVPSLVAAHEVITDVITVLKKHPAAAKLRTPDP